MNGNFGLSASIQKETCHDPVRRETFPYTGQINLPQGDMVSGCCRKLRPGEAAVGKHGLQPTTNTAQASGAPAAPGSSNAASRGSAEQRFLGCSAAAHASAGWRSATAVVRR